MTYTLTASNIENVSGGLLHKLEGDLEGRSLGSLVRQMRAGNTYVNLHMDDGVAPPDTGPGDFPGGEIRGQIWAVSTS
jgi:hypothetical protein